MWHYNEGFGFFLTDYRMSDVAASYIASVLEGQLRALRDIDASTSDEDLLVQLEKHRLANLEVMHGLVRQAPQGLMDTHRVVSDMDSVLAEIDRNRFKLAGVVALGSYVARSAVEAVHMTASFISSVRRRYAHLVHTLQKLLRPHKSEWLARARDLVMDDLRLRDLEIHVHFAEDPVSRRYGFRIKDEAFRRASMRGAH